jgi:general stress protein CsbA
MVMMYSDGDKEHYFGTVLMLLLRYIAQSDKKAYVHLMITIQKVTSNVHYLAHSYCLADGRQGQGDTRLTLTPFGIHNSKYVFMVNY